MKAKFLMPCLIGLSLGANAATVLPISEVYAHNEFSNESQGEDDMINGSGMNANPENGDAGWPTSGGHPSTWTVTSGAYQSEWQSGFQLSGATNSKIGWVVFDLGDTKMDLDELYLWHIRETSTRVATSFNVYTGLGSVTAPTHGPDNTSSAVDYDFSGAGWTLAGSGVGTSQGTSKISLGNATGRYVGIEILSSGGDTARVGFAEVGITQVPEPSAALLGALGVFSLLRRRR